VTRLLAGQLRNSGSISGRGKRFFPTAKHPDCSPPSFLFKGTGGSVMKSTAVQHEVSHSLPFSTKFRNEWVCISTPPYAFTVYIYIISN